MSIIQFPRVSRLTHPALLRAPLLGATLLGATMVVAPAAVQAQTATPQPVDCTALSAKPQPVDAASTFNVMGAGDRVKLSFYEVLQQQEDKWNDRARLQAPARGFQFRVELSGEYIVQEDGTLAIPLLGVFHVEGQNALTLQAHLECVFGNVVGRKGLVNVLNITKKPIYVVGPVKKSGSFDFMPGMTVLQAIALAGGLERQVVEPFQAAEVTRESEKLQQALDRAIRMMARSVVLNAELNGKTATAPPELVDLGGASAVNALSEESSARRLELLAQRNQEVALRATMEAAESELKARKSRVEFLQSAIALRRERLANLNQLGEKGSIGKPMILQAQAELADGEDKLQDTQTAIAAAQEKLEKAQQDLKRLKLQADITAQQDGLAARIEARKALIESDGAASVARAMIRSQNSTPTLQDLGFQLVRRVGQDVVIIDANETTVLQPGDLVQVGVRTKKPTGTAELPD